jgi:hypothetical protein
MAKSNMKLDGQLIAALGCRSPGFDTIRFNGLSGGQVKQDMGNFDGPARPNMKDHIKGKFARNEIHKYVSPRIENGIAIVSKRLKHKMYSSGVYFPVEEEYQPEAIGTVGKPGEEYVKLSPEVWTGKRVNMNGTQVTRNHGGFRGKKVRVSK